MYMANKRQDNILLSQTYSFHSLPIDNTCLCSDGPVSQNNVVCTLSNNTNNNINTNPYHAHCSPLTNELECNDNEGNKAVMNCVCCSNKTHAGTFADPALLLHHEKACGDNKNVNNIASDSSNIVHNT